MTAGIDGEVEDLIVSFLLAVSQPVNLFLRIITTLALAQMNFLFEYK